MRLWMIDPEVLCRRHLLGEHVEVHMFVGSINSGISMLGFVEKGLLEYSSLHDRHEVLTREMLRRGYAHNSPLPELHPPAPIPKQVEQSKVDSDSAAYELISRCPDCRRRFRSLGYIFEEG